MRYYDLSAQTRFPMSTNAYRFRTALGWIALAAALVPRAHSADLEAAVKSVDSKVLAWRRDIHLHPELSNRETRTAGLVADHLRGLGLEVETGIARTGVVALLKSGKPGPTIALRADMDALPVVERTDVPFRSTARSNYRGEEVGVMHACGHDSHTAVLMGVAEVLVKLKSQLRGNVLFVFQPAEEGAPPGEEGGASVMLKEGLFQKYQPEVAIGWQPGHRSIPASSAIAAGHSWRARRAGRQWWPASKPMARAPGRVWIPS